MKKTLILLSLLAYTVSVKAQSKHLLKIDTSRLTFAVGVTIIGGYSIFEMPGARMDADSCWHMKDTTATLNYLLKLYTEDIKRDYKNRKKLIASANKALSQVNLITGVINNKPAYYKSVKEYLKASGSTITFSTKKPQVIKHSL